MQVKTSCFFKNLKSAIDARGGVIIVSDNHFIAEKFKKYAKRYFGASALLNLKGNSEELQEILTLVNPRYLIDLSALKRLEKGDNGALNSDSFSVIEYKDGTVQNNTYKLPKLVGSTELEGDVFYFERFISSATGQESSKDFRLIDEYLNVFFKELSGQQSEFKHSSEVDECLRKQQYCSVKYLYKAKPTHILHDINIAEFRIALGQALEKQIPTKIKNNTDYIIPVPNSGSFYAVGLSKASGIPFLPALTKVDVSERAFEIQDVNMRKRYLSDNMFVNEELIKGKNILLVDEAIFTGATLKSVCELVYSAGAKSVSIAIPSPYCFTNCEYYVQPERTLLLHKIQVHAVAAYFNVDNVTHLHKETYEEIIHKFKKDDNFCVSCFNPQGEMNV